MSVCTSQCVGGYVCVCTCVYVYVCIFMCVCVRACVRACEIIGLKCHEQQQAEPCKRVLRILLSQTMTQSVSG